MKIEYVILKPFSKNRLLEADFAVATILISFGAVLGKASALQLILMAVLEVVFYNVNIYIGIATLKVCYGFR